MNDLFTSVQSFITAYEAKAVDAATQGTAALRKLADYLDGQIAGLKFACGPDDTAQAVALHAKCVALCPECDRAPGNRAPKGFGLPGNPILTVLFQLLETFLASLAKPAPAPAA